MEQIADWLKKLGMPEYAESFAEDRIDLTVLQDLADQDVKDLGVVLGDRRKMLRHSRSRRRVSAAVSAPSTPMATEATRHHDAERRYWCVAISTVAAKHALS
jgi:hypothetical protein